MGESAQIDYSIYFMDIGLYLWQPSGYSNYFIINYY